MKSLISLLVILLLASVLTAQNPPSNFGQVGSVLRRQAAHQQSLQPVNNTQAFGLFAELGQITPQVVGLGPEVRNGGYLWMFGGGVSIDPWTGITMIDNTVDNHYHFFSLSILSNAAWPLPLGSPGHSEIFSDPTFLICPNSYFETMSPPVWVMTQDTSLITPVVPWPANFLRVRIPAHPALIGTVYSAQSYRLQDNPMPTLFASDEIAFALS